MPFPTRVIALFSLLLFASTAQADLPIVDDDGEGKNIRFAWNIDMDGGVSGDEYNGFEIGFGSIVYPLDQMVATYSYENRADEQNHQFLIGIEEYYPVTEQLKPYGIVGLGYRRNDPSTPSGTRGDGWFVKIGAGIILEMTETFSLYGELAYFGSDDQLWQDGVDYASHNVSALLGVRFSY